MLYNDRNTKTQFNKFLLGGKTNEEHNEYNYRFYNGSSRNQQNINRRFRNRNNIHLMGNKNFKEGNKVRQRGFGRNVRASKLLHHGYFIMYNGRED